MLVVGDGINQSVASGEEVFHHLVERPRDSGVTMVFSGIKKQVQKIMEHSGLYKEIGEQNFFRAEDMALDTVYSPICATNSRR